MMSPHVSYAAQKHRAPTWLTWYLLATWLSLRLIMSVWAALASSFCVPPCPLTSLEQNIPLWPPSRPILAWLERVWLSPWERWDVTYYIRIVDQGYRVDDGTAQFHPLLAWLATPLHWMGLAPLLSLMVVSSIASLVLLLVFEHLARLDLNVQQTYTSTLLLITAPPAFIVFAPYTEGLFLLWAVLCFWCVRQDRWWAAGIAGALAVLTRQQGLFLLFPLAWELWEAAGRNWRCALLRWKDWLALGCIPLGLLIWLVYRALALNDMQPNWHSVHTIIYSVLISPGASKVVPHQTFMWPWQALWLALTIFWRTREYELAIDLVAGFAFLMLLALAWKQMRLSYRIYTLVITLVSFSYHTGPFYPYMGLPRHLLLAFPIFIGLAPMVSHVRARRWMTVAGFLGMVLLLFHYVIHGWVP